MGCELGDEAPERIPEGITSLFITNHPKPFFVWFSFYNAQNQSHDSQSHAQKQAVGQRGGAGLQPGASQKPEKTETALFLYGFENQRSNKKEVICMIFAL